MSAIHTNDTIIAIATPAGEGAIGIIRLSGSQAIELVDGLFRESVLCSK